MGGDPPDAASTALKAYVARGRKLNPGHGFGDCSAIETVRDFGYQYRSLPSVPKEVAARAGHTSVIFTLGRCGHQLPGSEQRLNDTLDALAEGSRPTAEVIHDADDAVDECARRTEKTTSFAHVACMPEDRDESVSDAKP